MPFPLVKKESTPSAQAFNSKDILGRANALFEAQQAKDLRGAIAEKMEDLRHYDVLGMDRVAAILMWGRSGTLLLASYLDNHSDVIMLPELASQRLYEFFERHQSLPLRDKLLAYPAFEPEYPRFFHDDSAISPTGYYAAVQAIVEFYAKWPPESLESRRAFFLFVHIAYNLALGRQPVNSRPLIVYAQHVWDDLLAKQLVEDFPQAKFIHTVRDPISSADAVFHFHLKIVEHHILLPYTALFNLTNKDRPHTGMESRTRTIRFEDLHAAVAGTMGDLADWLGLPYEATLLESTFNGIPYVMARDGKAWSGRSLEQTQRHSRHQSLKDRALLFAVFYENFVEWNYPCPNILRYLFLRCAVFAALFLFPTKMEIIAVRDVFKRTILPSLRHGKVSPALKFLLAIGLCRVKIIWLLTNAFLRRCGRGSSLLRVEVKRQAPELHEDGAQAASRVA